MRNTPTFQLAGIVLAALLLPGATVMAGTITIATFADPSQISSMPLFTVDPSTPDPRIQGGWEDGLTGLNLQVVVAPGGSYADAFFTLEDQYGGPGLEFYPSSPGAFSGMTGPGTVRLYEAGDVPERDEPLIRIDFVSAELVVGGMAGYSLWAPDNVDITGAAVPEGLTQEAFAFAFANQQLDDDGCLTATASFTSSAVIPEPSMVALFGFALMTVVGRRRRT